MTAQVDLAAREMAFRARVDGPADGPLVLLLHGFPQTSWEWHHQLPVLAAAGYRAVAPDQRGYSPGARPSRVDAYAIDELVADVLAFADTLGAQRFHLVGHDWGAIVSWHVAAARPERIESLTIVSVPHPTPWSRALRGEGGTDQPTRSQYFEWFRTPTAADELGGVDGAGVRAAYEASGLAGHDVEPHLEVLADRNALDAGLNWYRAYDFHHTALAEHHGADAVRVEHRGPGDRAGAGRVDRRPRRCALPVRGVRRRGPLDPRGGGRRASRACCWTTCPPPPRRNTE